MEPAYVPSPRGYVAEQVERYEATGGREGGTIQGVACVILTTRGRRTGALRKCALVRVEHGGEYAVIASQGGAPTHPFWYRNLEADPRVRLQDGDHVIELSARTAVGDERREWWARAVAVWPAFDDYATRTTRTIPVVVFDPPG